MYDNDQRVHTPSQMMARAVFTATFTRPLPCPDGVAALRRVGIPSPEQVLDEHRLCYPPTDPATVCEPLYPDRLGEDFLTLHTPVTISPATSPTPGPTPPLPVYLPGMRTLTVSSGCRPTRHRRSRC
ncbi:MAG: hypothetical protein ACRDUV_06670 [Pseudonocardiaceae bacterium]